MAAHAIRSHFFGGGSARVAILLERRRVTVTGRSRDGRKLTRSLILVQPLHLDLFVEALVVG